MLEAITKKNREQKYDKPQYDITNIFRTLAALSVFVLHGRQFIPEIKDCPFLYYITSLPAWAGVWIFFFLSGYTIGLGFYQGRYQVSDGNNKLLLRDFVIFYWGRFLKIAPMYFAYILVFELFSEQKILVNNPLLLLRIFTFSFNGNNAPTGIGHLWYISTAMQLYLIMPLFYCIVCKNERKKTVTVLLVAISAMGLLARSVLHYANEDWYTKIYTFTPCNLDLIFCGMLAACLKVKHFSSSCDRRLIRCFTWMVVVGLLMYNISIYASDNPTYLTIYRIYLPTAYLLVCTVAVLALGDLSYYRLEKFNKRLVPKVIDWFSGISYPFYIVHIIVFVYVERVLSSFESYKNWDSATRVCAFYLASFMLTIISALIFSKITVRRKKKHGM